MAANKVSKVIQYAILAVGLTAAAATAAGVPGDPHGGAYLGVTVQNVPVDQAAMWHLKNGGASIANVDQDGPAFRAGLKDGDIVVAFNGKPVANAGQLAELIHASAPGSPVNLSVVRGGKSVDIRATLGDWRHMAGPPAPPLSPVGTLPAPVAPMPPMTGRAYPEIDMVGSTTISARHGVVVEALCPQLSEYFGVGQNGGVLVRTVEKGSPGAAAGLKAGDVIVKMSNEVIHDTADWRRALKGQTGKVPMTIVRDKKEISVQMTLPASTSENQKWDGFGAIEDEMALLNSEQIAGIQHQAEAAAKAWTPEMKKQTEELRKKAEEMSREWARTTPEMAKRMADAAKPSAKELSDMTADMAKQWKAMQPQFEKQMNEFKKEMDEFKKQMEELQNNGPKQM